MPRNSDKWPQTYPQNEGFVGGFFGIFLVVSWGLDPRAFQGAPKGRPRCQKGAKMEPHGLPKDLARVLKASPKVPIWSHTAILNR